MAHRCTTFRLFISVITTPNITRIIYRYYLNFCEQVATRQQLPHLRQHLHYLINLYVLHLRRTFSPPRAVRLAGESVVINRL